MPKGLSSSRSVSEYADTAALVALYADANGKGIRASIEATLTIVGVVLELRAAAMRRGVNVVTTSNRPNTLVSNILRTWLGSASNAGASYTVVEFSTYEIEK